MTASRSFAAVDLGAQSGRVVLGTFTPDGLALDEVHRFANEPITVSGTLCWDTSGLFDQTLIGIARACSLAGFRGGRIEGISVDSWGVDYGLVDAGGSLAPGHGELMPEPMAVVDGIIRHRLNREAKVAQVLAVAGGTLDELVERAYDDVPRVMFPMARYSLWAHLLKLAREGRAVESGGRWEPPG